jgi:hypothetical protein
LRRAPKLPDLGSLVADVVVDLEAEAAEPQIQAD